MDNFYKEFCDPNDESLNYYMRVEHLGRYLFATKFINNEDLILDVACCNGYGTKILSKYCKEIEGIDDKKSYIELAIKNNNSNNIKYINADIDYYNFTKKYDLVVCFETIEHIKYPEAFLKKISKCLNKNAILLLSFPNAKYEHIVDGKNSDKYHLHIFNIETIEHIIKKYFSIVDILGQSKTNKIVNGLESYYGNFNLYDDAATIGMPNREGIDDTYSYIFILKSK